MFTNIGQHAVWPLTLIVVGIIGALTFLAYEGKVSGSDVVSMTILVLGAVGVGAGAHIGGQTASNAINGALHGPSAPIVKAPEVTQTVLAPDQSSTPTA